MIKTLKLATILFLGAVIGASAYVYNNFDTKEAVLSFGGPSTQNFLNIQPFVDNTYDNGTSTNAWKNVFTYGLKVSTTTTGCLQGGTTGSFVTAYFTGTDCGSGGTNFWTNSGSNTYLNTGTFAQAPAFTATSSSATTTVQYFNNIFYVPADFATNGCAGSSANNTLDLCVEALLDLAVTKGLTGATVWITNDVPQSAWTATMDIDNNGLQVNLFCRPGTRVKYGGSGNAILWNNGDPTGHVKQEIAGCTFMGQNTLIAANQSNSTTTVGIYYGGGQGAVGINTHDNTFNGFGTQVEVGANAYMLEFNNNGFSGGNGGRAGQGSLVHINTASNSGERNVFHGNNFTDPANSDADECFYIEQTGTASNFITNNSIDNCQIVVLASNGQVVISENHFENPGAPSGFAEYIPILGASSDGSVTMNINGNEFANSATNRTWTTIIRHGGQLFASGNRIDNYNGFTVTNFVLHDLNNGQSSDHVCQTQVQGGSLTNIIGGSGGTSWSLTNGVPCLINRSNSYTIGLRALGSNVNQFFSGNSTVGTFDHDGNWTLGDSAVNGLTTVYNRLYAPVSIGIGTSSPFTMLGVAGTITSNAINATSTATSTIANLGGVLYAPAFQDSGEDIGKAINDAYAFCPLKSCIIDVPRGQFTFSTPILLDTDGKRALIRGTPAGGTTLTYSGTATSTTINWGIQDTGIDHTSGCGIRDIVFKNTDTGTSRATSTNPIIGIEVGGINGSDCTELTNVDIQGFGFNLWLSANNYNFNFQNGMIRNGGRAVHIAPASNSGELISFNDAFIVDNYATYGAEADQCFYMEDSAVASLLLNGVSMDDCQMDIGQANNVTINGGHWENVGFSSWGKYTYIVVDNNVATNLSINGTTFFNMATTLGNSPDQFISNGGTLTMNGVIFRRFGGITIPVAVTTTGSGRMTWSGLNNVSNAVFTELASGLPYTMNGSTGTSNFASMGIGTTTQHFQLTVSSTTKPQLSLGAGAGLRQWTFRNAGGNFFLSTSTVDGLSTTSISALEIDGTSGTTTLRGLNISGYATSTSNVGFNITTGCYAIAGTCIGAGGSGLTSYDAWTHPSAGISATTSILSFPYSSSTAYSSFQTSSTTLGLFGTASIGSTSPFAKLSINPNTGDTASFVIGSSTATRLIVDNAGKMALGTAFPSSFVTLVGNVSDTADIGTVSSAGGNSNAQLSFAPASDGLNRWGIRLSSTLTDLNFDFRQRGGTNTRTLLTLSRDGVLGIGTTTPSLQSTLTIASTTNPQLSLSAGAGLSQWTFRNAGGNFYLSTTTVLGTATTSTSALTITNGGEYFLSTTTAGTLKVTSTGLLWSDTSSGGGGYNLVQDEGTPLTARTTLNFTGSGVSCADNGGSSRTDCTINAGAATAGGSDGQIQFNDATALGGTSGLVWNKAGKLGLGTTTPWAIFSMASTTYNYTLPLMHVSTSSDAFGNLFHVSATSTTLVSNTFNGKVTEVGTRVGIGLWDYRGYGGLLDPLTVKGRINTYGTLQNWCDAAQFTALSADGIFTACPGWYFAEDNTGTTAINVGNSYQGTRVSASTAAVNNDGAGVFFSPNTSTGWFTLASSTPVLETNWRMRNSTATTSIYMVGFSNINIAGTTYEAEPTVGCFFIASSTANIRAVSKTSNTAATYFDTGIASTSSNAANGTAYQYRFMRVQGGNGKCEFFIQASGSNNLISFTSTTNVPSDTLLNAGMHYGIVSQNTSSGFDFFRNRFWWNDMLPSL